MPSLENDFLVADANILSVPNTSCYRLDHWLTFCSLILRLRVTTANTMISLLLPRTPVLPPRPFSLLHWEERFASWSWCSEIVPWELWKVALLWMCISVGGCWSLPGGAAGDRKDTWPSNAGSGDLLPSFSSHFPRMLVTSHWGTDPEHKAWAFSLTFEHTMSLLGLRSSWDRNPDPHHAHRTHQPSLQAAIRHFRGSSEVCSGELDARRASWSHLN